jgi:hypothetical protein
MKNLERELNPFTVVICSSRVALESCGNSGLRSEGVVTDGATAWYQMTLDSSGCSHPSLSGPEAEEGAEDEDYSWMDDMEAAGVAPV